MADLSSKKTNTRPALVIRDNVPEGCAVSLAGIPAPLSFASMFRDELQARGFGIQPNGKREQSPLLG